MSTTSRTKNPRFPVKRENTTEPPDIRPGALPGTIHIAQNSQEKRKATKKE